jgi:DNA-binding IclR family transcriptional regulator
MTASGLSADASPVRRTLAVLDAFTAADDALSLRELSRRTGLPLSSVQRLAAHLVAWGGLERTREGLRPGLRLFELGQLVPQRMHLREVALPFLGDLHEATRHVAVIAVLDGAETVFIEQIAGRLGPPVPSRVGGRLPANVTAAGKALLAFGGEGVLDRLGPDDLPARTPNTITSLPALEAELESIRRAGFAVNREESQLGVLGVAAPILDARGAAAAVVALTLPRGARRSPQALAPTVRAAALGIARALRASPTRPPVDRPA